MAEQAGQEEAGSQTGSRVRDGPSPLVRHGAVLVRSLGGAGDRWLRSGLARDALGLLLATVLGVVIAFVMFDRFWAQSRLAMWVTVEGAQLGALSHAVRRLPPADRTDFLAELERRSDGAIEVRQPPGGFEEPADRMILRLQSLRGYLPQETVGWSSGPTPALWMAVAGPPSGGPQWIAVPQPGRSESWWPVAFVLAAACLLVCALAAAYLLRRLKLSLSDGAKGAGEAPRVAELRAELRALIRGDVASATPAFQQLVAGVRHLAGGASRQHAGAEQPAAGHAAVHPRWSFATDVALLMVLLCAAIATVALTLEHAVVRPRGAHGAVAVAQQLRIMREVVSTLPAADVRSYLDDVERLGAGLLQRAELPPEVAVAPVLPSSAQLMELVRDRLPNTELRFATGQERALWIQLPVQAGSPDWIAYSVPRYLEAVIAGVAGLLLLALGGSVAMVWRSRVRLSRARHAIERVRSDGASSDWRVPAASDRDGAAESQGVRHPLVRQRLLQEERQRERRALALSDLAADLRSALDTWRERRPEGIDPQVFRDGVGTLVQALAQLDEFQRAASVPPLLDVNELLTHLQQHNQYRIELALGGIPYLRMQRSQAWRLIEGMADHVAAGGSDALSFSTGMEGTRVVLRAVATGRATPAASGQRTPDEADPLLALDVARHIVRAHKGTLVVGPQLGAPWIEVRLPTARLD